MFLYLLLVISGVICASDDSNLSYDLNIGHAIDIFANFGDLSQVTQVVSDDYEEEEESDVIEPFREKNIKIFANASSKEHGGKTMMEMTIFTGETFEELLNGYFQNFHIEGTKKPWKAFMGDWITDEIMRTFGIEFDTQPNSEDCCFVLVKMSRIHKSVELGNLSGVGLKGYVNNAIEELDVNSTAQVRKFMKSYGTHYISHYETGNFIYQVFKFKRNGYNHLKAYIKRRTSKQRGVDNLRFYFSSFFLRQVGNIRIASGNKTIERWARLNLKDSHYLFSRPNLLRINYNRDLAFKLNKLLDDTALLGLKLKTLRPIFKDQEKAERYAEIVENDMLLWEINA